MALKSVEDDYGLQLQKRNKCKEITDDTKPNEKVMRPVKLKNIVDWFLKAPEEKSPIIPSSTKTVQYTGINSKQINKMDESGSSEKGFYPRKSSEEKSTTESEEHLEKKPKMSILRKLCFLLSLNGGIVYAAAFLWFIPCRQPFCLMKQKDWAVTVSGNLTSNMEASPSSSSELSFVIFGYSDNIGGHLAAFSVADGKRKWNKRNDYDIKHVFCNLNLPEGSPERISKCFLTGYNYIAAFDDSNGNLFWEQNITRLNGEVMHKIALSGNAKSGYHILGVSDAYLFVVKAKNGCLVSTADLPCQWTLDIKLLGPLENRTWVMVCEFGDSVEVWTFNEKDLLNLSIQSDVDGKSKPDDQKFKLLFKRSSAKNSESIDLGGDVTRIGDSFVLSWADMVSMVTAQAPSQPTRLWEVRKWGSAHPHSVTSIISGSFTNLNKMQIAVAVKDEYNTTIHILDAINGTSVLETNLGSRNVMSMEKIAGENGEPDVIVIESVPKVKSNVDFSTSEVVLPTSRAYFTIQYSSKNVTYQNIASTGASKSLLIPHSHGYASLILASNDFNGKLLLKRYVITSKQQEAVCHWGVHANSTTYLLLD